MRRKLGASALTRCLALASRAMFGSNLAVFGHTFLLFWPGTCPNRSEMAVGFTGTDFQAKPSNRRFWTHFGTFFMVLARLENQVWAKTWPGHPNQACRFENFFSGPHSGAFFCNLFAAFPVQQCSALWPEWGPEKSSGICRPGWR